MIVVVILIVVVAIVRVVIAIIWVVVVVGGVFIIKLSFVIIVTFPSMLLGDLVGLLYPNRLGICIPPRQGIVGFLLGLSAFAMAAACASRTTTTPSVISYRIAASVIAGVVDVDVLLGGIYQHIHANIE
nr:hypothetical protein [Tanacetum cinerariifolium]